ncbi:unnamed protein product [Amoebophrya sp. A120]|nr:unnamed protein product [Amoebophrya sp. A120]|eukprot:GSA120T00016177001.1
MMQHPSDHDNYPQQSKVLLMGRASAGKTSIRSIIFANYLARETSRLHPTNNVEHCNLRFLGSLQLNLWDCGGQDVFMENYFESQKDHIFRNVSVLIYVLGSTASLTQTATGGAPQGQVANQEVQRDMTYLKNTCENIKQLSPGAKVFVLVHKMDLIHEKDRSLVFQRYEQQINSIAGADLVGSVKCFATSIWDETLFKAWSNIVYSLIPNITMIDKQLKYFCETCEADEVVLFEKATFVVISHTTRREFRDPHRFEKISNIIKQFKLSCGRANSSFKRLSVQTETFTAFIEKFTHNTCLMLIVTDKDVHPAAAIANIDVARKHFERIIK